MIDTAVIGIVLIMNIISALYYYKGKEYVGLILKALADGISLIYLCTR